MAKNKVFKSMDGNEAASYISYAFTEVAGIFPITPSSPMAEHVDAWAANGKKNLFGEPVKVVEMQSEGGAAGSLHSWVRLLHLDLPAFERVYAALPLSQWTMSWVPFTAAAFAAGWFFGAGRNE